MRCNRFLWSRLGIGGGLSPTCRFRATAPGVVQHILGTPLPLPLVTARNERWSSTVQSGSAGGPAEQ